LTVIVAFLFHTNYRLSIYESHRVKINHLFGVFLGDRQNGRLRHETGGKTRIAVGFITADFWMNISQTIFIGGEDFFWYL
jgi:hypothetical protein